MVDDILGSEIKAELLLLFRRNPGLVDSIEGVARRIGRKSDGISRDLDGLVTMGAVLKRRIGNSDVFSLNSRGDQAVQSAVGGYLAGIRR